MNVTFVQSIYYANNGICNMPQCLLFLGPLNATSWDVLKYQKNQKRPQIPNMSVSRSNGKFLNLYLLLQSDVARHFRARKRRYSDSTYRTTLETVFFRFTSHGRILRYVLDHCCADNTGCRDEPR